MNIITTEQNTVRQLQRLATQRQLYATAKTIFSLQLFLSGPVAVMTVFLGVASPSLKGYIALWGLVIALLDIMWLNPWQKRLRDSAARVQELFDCDVFSLPWNDLKAGKRPDPELVKEQSDKYAKWASKMPPLTNWYSTEIVDLPLHWGRIACQRSNCWWDSKQRRRYAFTVISGVAVMFFAVLCIAMRNGLTVEDFILTVVAPLAPVLMLGIRQYTEHNDAAARLDKLKEHAEKLWNDALAGMDESSMTSASRVLQDEILESRRRSPLVFDAIFKRLRHGYEDQMNFATAELAAEARQKLRSA